MQQVIQTSEVVAPLAELPNLPELRCDDAHQGKWLARTPAWLVSAVWHAALLLVIGTLTVPPRHRPTALSLTMFTRSEQLEDIPQDFEISELTVEEYGAESLTGDAVALSQAPEVGISQLSAPPLAEADLGNFELLETLDRATGRELNREFAVRGVAGVGVTGASGAIDRLTHEILLSLEQRPTLVVWLLDQSASLTRQRREIQNRFGRIYRELGQIQASGTAQRTEDKPLLSSVIGFGKKITLKTDKPTSDVDRLTAAVADIVRDDSGVENVFGAVIMAVSEYKKFRRRNPDTSQPIRNVMLIAFTDEAGDDYALVDRAVDACRRAEMPVYVVGVPAPFGRRTSYVKWIDPDPTYDQTPAWGPVNQGPESLFPERIRLGFDGPPERETLVDSGFGPFALTRLCYESGGIYFAVHPNREKNRPLRKNETPAFSAFLNVFFDQDTMRTYRPDYVSAAEYLRRLANSPVRQALVEAAKQSWASPMESPRRRFVVRTEAEFVEALTNAQKAAAKVEPQLTRLYQILKSSESGRELENTPRWQAGFDLAYGRTQANLVRAKTYNAMLAKAKKGLAPKKENSNTWTIRPHRQVDINSQLSKLGEKAHASLQRVIDEHPGTPWAHLAKRELGIPFGWKWYESYTPLEQPRSTAAGRQNRTPTDQQAQFIRRKPTRPVPKL